MNNKNKAVGMGLLYAMLAGYSIKENIFNDGNMGHGIPDKPKKIIPKGCKEYTYKGITVVATSEKKAIDKINKRLVKQSNDK